MLAFMTDEDFQNLQESSLMVLLSVTLSELECNQQDYNYDPALVFLFETIQRYPRMLGSQNANLARLLLDGVHDVLVNKRFESAALTTEDQTLLLSNLRVECVVSRN
jgi:hypothetical protein